MDTFTLRDLEAGVIGGADDVTNSSNLKDTNMQQYGLTLPAENNLHNNQAVLSDKTEENVKTDNTGVNPSNTTDGSWPCNIENSGSLPIQNLGVTCVASKSLLDILAYGSSSSSSSADSEPDSVDLIQDSKSSDSSDSDWEEIPSNNDNVKNARNYRDSRCPSSDNTSDSNESLDDDMEVGAIGAVKPILKKNTRTEGELELDELPPVPDLSKLSLNVKTEDCIQMGKISNIIDRLVTVESLPKTPAYDLDTLLFLDQGKIPLGYVYDVIGQVTSPIYVVRFNSKEEIESRGITKGLPVYSAPNSEHTQFVFLKELLRMKGSDASWQGDNEVPSEFLDFSDDEVEFLGYQPRYTNEKIIHVHKKKRNSLDKHRIFETTMNLKNEVNSARYKTQDVIEPTVTQDVPRRNLKFYHHHPPPPLPPCHVRPPLNRGFFNTYPSPNFTMPPNFNMMNMPPPMFNVHVPPYPIMHFPPNPQFPPPTFGSPAIPPLPHMSHVPAQPPPPGYHPGGLPVLPTNIPLAVCRPVAQLPKMLQSTGVVPKSRLPRKYAASADYQYAHNLRPPREMNPYVNNVRQHPPSSLGSQSYNPAAGAFHKSPPNNTGGTAFKNP